MACCGNGSGVVRQQQLIVVAAKPAALPMRTVVKQLPRQKPLPVSVVDKHRG